MATNELGVKVKLEGERQYIEQMKQITQQTKLMKAETNQMESSWTKGTSAMQKASDQAQLLRNQIELQKSAVATAEANVKTYAHETGEGSSQTLKWKTALAEAKAELSRLEGELRNVPNKIQIMGQKMQVAGEKIKTAGKAITGVGTSMTRYVTAPIAAVSVASVKVATDFETSMAKVSTIADSTVVPIEDMSAAIINLSNETGVSATDLSEAVYQAISAGQDTADAVEFVAQTTKLAKAGFTDSADAVDVMTTVLNAYDMEAKDATRVSDKLIKTQNLGKTTVAQLAESMGAVIPYAAAYNVSLDELSAGYVTLTKNGINTAESTTALKGLINELGKSGSKSAKILEEKTGKSFAELMDNGYSLTDVLAIVQEGADETGVSLGDMFSNQRAKTGALSLMQNADDFTAALEEMGESAGTTEEALSKVTGTKAAEFNKALNKIKNTGIELGQSILTTLAPTIQSIGEHIESAIEWFDKLDESEKERIVKFGLFAAAAGPVITAVGKVATGIGSIVSTGGKLTEWFGSTIGGMGGVESAVGSAAGAFGPLFLAVGGVVGAVALAKAGYENFRNAAKDANEDLYSSIDAVDATTRALEGASDAMKDGFTEADKAIQEVEASAKAATTIADEIEELTRKTKLTHAEQTRLKALVGEMNVMFPEMGLAINEATGALSMSNEEIREYIDNAYKIAKAEAYANALKTAMTNMADAELKLAQAQIASDRLLDERAELEKQVADATEDRSNITWTAALTDSDAAVKKAKLNDEITTGKVALEDSQEALEANKEAQEEANQTLDESQKYYDDTYKAVEELAQEMGMSVDELINMKEAAEESGEAIENSGDAASNAADNLGEYGDAAEDAAEDIDDATKKIIDAYISAKDSAYDSLMSQTGFWEKLEEQENTSVESMRQGLEDHLQAYSEWNSNATKLMSSARYATDENFRAMVNSIVGAGIDAAPELRVLAGIYEEGGENLEQFTNNYGNTASMADEMAANIAAAQVIAEYGIDGLAKAIEEGEIPVTDAIRGMMKAAGIEIKNHNSVAKEAGTSWVKSLADSIETGSPVRKAVQGIWDAIGKTTQPSKKAGSAQASAYTEGATQGKGGVAEAGEVLKGIVANSNNEIAQESAQARLAGSQIVGALSEGLTNGSNMVLTAMQTITSRVKIGISDVAREKSTAKSAGSDVAGNIASGMDDKRSSIVGALESIKSSIDTALSNISAKKFDATKAGNDIANAVSTALQKDTGSASTWGRQIGDNFGSGIGSANGTVSMKAGQLATAAQEMKRDVDNAATWGRHMGDNFANGIGSAYANVVAQARLIANAARNNLGHSTPKEGPLKNDDVWGLHMGQNFARGMERSIPLIKTASQQMAGAALFDVDMASGRDNTLTGDSIFEAVSAALGMADLRVIIGNREFGRILREAGA